MIVAEAAIKYEMKNPVPPPRQLWMEDSEALGPSRVPEVKEKQVLSLKSFEYALKTLPDHSRQSKQQHLAERPVSRECLPTFKQKPEHVYVNLKNQRYVKPAEKDLHSCNWYIREFDRQEAEEALLQENCDGVFLVRDCSRKSIEEPYVLVIFYRSRVYNIKVRFLEASQQYALGSGLKGNDVSGFTFFGFLCLFSVN
ncbi:hypothetical protein NDU88_001777 [Pleurodeles waltl]|uniref:SH2 domain-containing protein n=1 Tax=Pleurodeles waltl TaxID=8319 RepID=A0AAV7WN58_PLEWA|nr:hypothetical protein NDU88_001777 [Pleurodeles waltl]